MGSHGEKTQGPSGGFEKLPTTEWLTGFHGISSVQIFSGILGIDLSNVNGFTPLSFAFGENKF
jgi:hypothetical protein